MKKIKIILLIILVICLLIFIINFIRNSTIINNITHKNQEIFSSQNVYIEEKTYIHSELNTVNKIYHKDGVYKIDTYDSNNALQSTSYKNENNGETKTLYFFEEPSESDDFNQELIDSLNINFNLLNNYLAKYIKKVNNTYLLNDNSGVLEYYYNKDNFNLERIVNNTQDTNSEIILNYEFDIVTDEDIQRPIL